MAGPAQLLQTVSLATGVPLATVTDIDRKLVAAGLRTKGGRGRSAARMTAVDAARLLVAILASPQANAAAEAAERYGQTRPDKARSSDGLFRVANLDDLAALPARHSFVDALAALISSAASGSLSQPMSVTGKGRRPHIEVFAFTRATWGRIRLSGLPNGLTASVEYRPATTGKTATSQALTDGPGDLEQSRRVTERTILPIADLLK